MRISQDFESHLTSELRQEFRSLTSPALIQAYLDHLPYIAEELDRSPLRVMADRQAHCLDGGIFAALALNRLGYRALILDLVPAPGMDDDHVLALYSVQDCWGCLAKSNYAPLRSREPVYRTLRELAMSYFDFYFTTKKEKSLRGYTRPLDLASFPPNWSWDEAGVARITHRLYARPSIALISPESEDRLSLADERTYQSACLGIDFSWAYGIRRNH